MIRFRNTDPFEPWNSTPTQNDPSAPWNGYDKNDPFAPWNEPFGHWDEEAKEKYDYYEG
jgi:hypothetical protein